MLSYTIKHKIRWLVYSSENEPHSIIRKLVEYLAQKPINKILTRGVPYAHRVLYIITLRL